MTPRSKPKYLGLGPACRVRTGNHEPESVRRDHFATAPVLHEQNLILLGHQAGIGVNQRLIANEVLTDLGEPSTSQSRRIIPRQRLQSDIARLREEDGTEAGGQV